MSATLAGTSCTKCRVQVPAWGLPWADVDLDVERTFSRGELLDLVVADVSLRMAVVSGGAHEGRSAYRLVGGKGRWGEIIPRRSYLNDGKVKASSVLSDAAKACGETITDLPATLLGTHYARAEDSAMMVLHDLALKNWYVDFAGVTHIGQRPTTSYTGQAPRTRVEPGGQVIELATETLVGLVPGVVVDGYGPATDVEFYVEPKRITARLWGGPSRTSRRLNAFRELVRMAVPDLRYRGVYEFRVVTQVGERLNLQPVRASTGFDALANVPVRPGVYGMKATVVPGELVLVAFVDADPSRPVVVSHDAADAPGTPGGAAALGVARLTDLVVAGPFGGAITFSSAKVKAVL